MKINRLTGAAFEINALIDSGTKLAIPAVRRAIDDGTILTVLTAAGANFTLLSVGEQAELVEQWQSMANAIDAQRKFGVQNDGLSLLLAYLLQGIQDIAREAENR